MTRVFRVFQLSLFLLSVATGLSLFNIWFFGSYSRFTATFGSTATPCDDPTNGGCRDHDAATAPSLRRANKGGNGDVNVNVNGPDDAGTNHHGGREKLPLYLITPSSRPHYLTKAIFHVLPLHRCYDVRWIIVHGGRGGQQQQQVPLFRGVFPWIDELFVTPPVESISGNHERNVGIDHLLTYLTNLTGRGPNGDNNNDYNNNNKGGLVYFLDDDNTPSSDLCPEDGAPRPALEADKMYYGDQYQCGRRRLDLSNLSQRWAACNTNSSSIDGEDSTTDGTDGATTDGPSSSCSQFSLAGKTDTGSFLAPVWLLRDYPALRWRLPLYDADGYFWTDVVRALIRHDGGRDGRVVRLEGDGDGAPVRFHYNELNNDGGSIVWTAPLTWTRQQLSESLRLYRNRGCPEWRDPWTAGQLSDSLSLYRRVSGEVALRAAEEEEESSSAASAATSAATSGQPQPQLPQIAAAHEYGHILHVLRMFVPARRTATYVEIGGGGGGATTVTSVLMARHPLRTRVLLGEGTGTPTSRIEPPNAIADLQEQLQGGTIDILYLGGDHRGAEEGPLVADFRLYAPMVSRGGFVVFDNFMDSKTSWGVRQAVMELIKQGDIDLERYDVFGSIKNTAGAGPSPQQDNDDRYDWQHYYDWQSVASNEFVLRKRTR